MTMQPRPGHARLVPILACSVALWAACGDDGAPSDPARPDAATPIDAAATDAIPDDATPPSDAPPAGIAEGIFAPLGQPVPAAAPDRLAAFARGRAVALRRFTPAQGLGDHFNATFCAACHQKPVLGGAAGRYRDYLLLGQQFPQGGGFGFAGVNGVQPQYRLTGVRFPTPAAATVSATRNALPLFGIGLLAEITESAILANADPDDLDRDGISGRPNYVNARVARFGVKAQSAAVDVFLRSPLFNHLGITTNPLSAELRAILEGGASGAITPAQSGAPNGPIIDNDGVPDPELSESDLFDLASFTMLLAAPQPDPSTPESEAGRQLFAQADCTACHVPALTAPRGLIPAYTDLLLHDMGSVLDDAMPQGVATGAEYRTAPLWGVAASAPYLHDGRADTLDQAIRLHDGEARPARDAFVAMSDQDQARVLAFLRSLGGASQASTGLLPPNAAIPAAGQYGGPATVLTATDLARFGRGRAIFDGDVSLAAGLGPLFNGDACRACHADPTVGGSGPNGVNVLRYGQVTSGVFTAPADGTRAMLHATASGLRPPIQSSASNFFEPRNTPPLFGLGLIERIDDATILAAADPDDDDGDGIRGRAHVLADGRLGRLGWKAHVPDLAEFAREALSSELGLTVPDQPGLTFGDATDSDTVTDPEISPADLGDLVFYLRALAPPPRTSVNPVLEAEGAQLFATIGCAACHTPTLVDRDGNDVPLYSDLLLHDVAPAGLFGIEEGDAGMRELRTPPLWGLATTGPYMHDGAAVTVDDAILRHAGEADAARAAFVALQPGEQGALRAFLESL